MVMLTDLADVLRAAGLPVIEVPGWKTRTRPGGIQDVRTITCHHTGGLKSLNTIVRGRDLGLPTELPGPLAQLFLDRNGTYYVVAAGRANHAGVSRSVDYTNEHAIGIEAEALGTGAVSDWPAVQMDSYVTGARALAAHYGAKVLGHKETCSPKGRKTDPSFDMGAFRARIAQEDDMPLTDADLDKIAHRVWQYNQDGARKQAWAYLIAAAADDVPALAKAVKNALPTGGAPITQDQLEKALRAVIGSVDN